ncbi:putative sodium-dependent noradrenaline transporter [Penaeus vannamei]|uniref:Transporter n=1 Tax=Penaeus vannamei TaxID=6689 RepID=A0A423U282_PENVA|nr:putative sodium-dependent noradrenaline transporter [Penaeus vannamei]
MWPPLPPPPASSACRVAAALPGGKSSVEGVTPPAATEVRLVSGGRVATRLAPAASPGHLPRDDGYCSSDSTPKSSGERRVAGVLPHPRAPPTDSPALGVDAGQHKPPPAGDADGALAGESVPVAAVAPRTPTASPGAPGGPPGPPNSTGVVDDGRESWGKSMDFLLSIIGFAVDLANVWRFPFLCYRNGGGAFLFPYFLITVFGALPLFFMELVLGQYNRQGPITVWKVCPLFRGVGYCAVLVAYFVSFYYNVIIAWSIHFVYASFSYVLPWTSCNNTWNTDDCWDGLTSDEPKPNSTSLMSPSEEYFNYVVLQMDKSDGIDDLGPPQPSLVICGLITYFILYLSLFKGVKSSAATGVCLGEPALPGRPRSPSSGAPGSPSPWQPQRSRLLFSVACLALAECLELVLDDMNYILYWCKVVWVTATMPYVIMTVLLIRGALLPGAADGLLYYIKPAGRPSPSRRYKGKGGVGWGVVGPLQAAAQQVFFSVGAGFGVHLSYASYNNFNNNCYRDCLITSLVNAFTSFYSGLVIFTYLGYMAFKQKTDIGTVATDGPGLVFQVYPEAVATLPGSQFWSCLFFLMLISLGLDSGMGGLECVITGMMDELRLTFGWKTIRREFFTALVVTSSFLVSIANFWRNVRVSLAGHVCCWNIASMLSPIRGRCCFLVLW